MYIYIYIIYIFIYIYICFTRKSQKVIFLGKIQEIYKCFRSKYQQYPAKFGQIMVFPTPGISLMTKDLIKIKVYTYFNIGDAKIKKWKEKQSKFYPTPWATKIIFHIKCINFSF